MFLVFVSENEMTFSVRILVSDSLRRCISETPLPTQDQTYLFFAVDSFDCIGKNFSAWQACDRLEGTYGAVAEQGQRQRIAAKSIVDSLAFGGRLNSVELTVVLASAMSPGC